MNFAFSHIFPTHRYVQAKFQKPHIDDVIDNDEEDIERSAGMRLKCEPYKICLFG